MYRYIDLGSEYSATHGSEILPHGSEILPHGSEILPYSHALKPWKNTSGINL
jgi:hypothetical protein